MIAFAGHVLIALILAGFFLGGGALFFIARQDDSHAGRLVGIISAAVSVIATLYLSVGHHWL
jgi:hypothetical protein